MAMKRSVLNPDSLFAPVKENQTGPKNLESPQRSLNFLGFLVGFLDIGIEFA
jgi:hypothetical protein